MATTPVNLAVTNVLSTSVRLTWEDALQALIAAIFGANEQGAFYVPRPVVNGAQALFQDAAGTVPVTADGDPVGRMIDQSGNGNHAIQTVSGSRPVYRTDGVLHWLQPDGIDDSFEYPASTTSTSHTMSVAHSPDSITGINSFLLDANSLARVVFGHLGSTYGKVGVFDGSWKEPDNANLGSQVVIYDLNGAQSDLGIYRNGSLLGSRLPYNPGAISPPARIFSSHDETRFLYAGRFYGMAIIHNTIATSKRSDLNSYLEGLGGVA